jgi:AcrR family transcriptional regulator
MNDAKASHMNDAKASHMNDAKASHMSDAKPDVPVVRARLDVDERRRQLVTLGTELFSTRTYDDVSIDEVARSAGISKGLLYHYFPTKRDFYVATVREAAAQLVGRTQTDPHLDQLERLRTGLDAFIDYVADHGTAYVGLLRSGIGADAEVARIVDETRESFCTRLIAGFEARNELARIALRGWVGFVEATILGWLAARETVQREAIRDMMIKVAIHVVQGSGD